MDLDCVSFKPNSTNIVVQGLSCNGSHGISVGSLGQYVGETDLVENIYVYNITMSNASDGPRIKVWPGYPSELSGDLQGGGGTGSVKNVTYDTMAVTNVDYAIEITQCYGQKNFTLCNQYPVCLPRSYPSKYRLADATQSSLTISDILFTNIHGTASGKYTPLVGNIVCSSPTACSHIVASDISVVGPNGTNAFTCLNVDDATPAVNCTAINEGYN
jgi:galacturan 1,4-alpha-galacturonidase